MDAFCNIKASLRNIIWFPISGCLGDFFVISYQRKADQFQTIILWFTNSASGVIRLILKQPWSPTQVIGFCETVLVCWLWSKVRPQQSYIPMGGGTLPPS